jgi:hypothetical protein
MVERPYAFGVMLRPKLLEALHEPDPFRNRSCGIMLACGFTGPQRDEVFVGKKQALPHSDGKLSAKWSNVIRLTPDACSGA